MKIRVRWLGSSLEFSETNKTEVVFLFSQEGKPNTFSLLGVQLPEDAKLGDWFDLTLEPERYDV